AKCERYATPMRVPWYRPEKVLTVSCCPDMNSKRAHRREWRWAFSFGIEHCRPFRCSSIIAAFRMDSFPRSTQSLSHFGVISVQTPTSGSPSESVPLEFSDNDCQQ